MMMKHALLLLLLVPTAASAAAPTSADRAMLTKLSRGNNAEIQLGQLVAQKAADPMVKQFAQKMVDDHNALMNQTKSWAASHSVQVDATPDADQTKTMNEFSALSGQDLDHRYIEDMLGDHKHDVAELAHFIVDYPKSGLTPMLKKALPVMEDHLRLAENVAGHIGVSPEAGLSQATPSG